MGGIGGLMGGKVGNWGNNREEGGGGRKNVAHQEKNGGRRRKMKAKRTEFSKNHCFGGPHFPPVVPVVRRTGPGVARAIVPSDGWAGPCAAAPGRAFVRHPLPFASPSSRHDGARDGTHDAPCALPPTHPEGLTGNGRFPPPSD